MVGGYKMKGLFFGFCQKEGAIVVFNYFKGKTISTFNGRKIPKSDVPGVFTSKRSLTVLALQPDNYAEIIQVHKPFNGKTIAYYRKIFFGKIPFDDPLSLKKLFEEERILGPYKTRFEKLHKELRIDSKKNHQTPKPLERKSVPHSQIRKLTHKFKPIKAAPESADQTDSIDSRHLAHKRNSFHVAYLAKLTDFEKDQLVH